MNNETNNKIKNSNNSMIIKLSDNLKQQANNGHLKTKDVIQHIISTVTGSATIKPIEQTALKDITINGQHVTVAYYDWKGELHLQLS